MRTVTPTIADLKATGVGRHLSQFAKNSCGPQQTLAKQLVQRWTPLAKANEAAKSPPGATAAPAAGPPSNLDDAFQRARAQQEKDRAPPAGRSAPPASATRYHSAPADARRVEEVRRSSLGPAPATPSK